MSIPEDPLHLPPRLTDDLRAIYGHVPDVPPGVDAAIAAAARRKFAQHQRARWLLRWGGGAAAILLLALRISPIFHHPPAAPAVAYARQDLLHHGRVDILDAYYLARQIDSHAPLKKEWDINGDGVVDQKDVDAIAAVAVRVGNEGGPP